MTMIWVWYMVWALIYDNGNELGVADRIEGWGDAGFPSFEEGRRIQRARAGDRGPNMGN